MNSKQEAQRIFDRFYNETLSHLSDHNTKEDARKSALICVDEIKLSQDYWMNGVDEDEHSYYQIYWEEVKEEIKKL